MDRFLPWLSQILGLEPPPSSPYVTTVKEKKKVQHVSLILVTVTFHKPHFDEKFKRNYNVLYY